MHWVLEGFRLSDAMGRPGAGFPPLYRAMVSAGETSGALQSILERLADRLEMDEQVRGKVITALVYPAVLAVVAIGVVIALMTFVVPRVVDQFDSMNQTLPLLTRLVIDAVAHQQPRRAAARPRQPDDGACESGEAPGVRGVPGVSARRRGRACPHPWLISGPLRKTRTTRAS